MTQVNIYVMTSTEVRKASERGYGYLIETDTKSGPVTVAETSRMTGTWHNVQLNAMLDALDRLTRPCRVAIYSRDDHVIGMARNMVPVWEKTGFRNAKGERVANAEEYEQLAEKMKLHEIAFMAGKHKYEYELIMRIKEDEEYV